MLFTWPSPALPRLTNPEGEFRFTLEQCSYLPVISAATSMITTPIFGSLCDRIGRKFTILLMAAIQSIAFMLAANAKSIYLFYLFRVFSGLSDACVFVAIPTYIGEVSTPKVRDAWGNACCFGFYLGQFIISIIGGYCTIKISALISLCFPIVSALTFYLMPESPYYLIVKSRNDDAYKALQWFLRVKNVDTEIKQLQTDVHRQISETGTWKDLFAIKSNRKALYAGLFLRIAQQFSGLTVMEVYTEYIFKQVGSNLSATNSAIIFLGSSTIAAFVAGIFFKRIGARRAVKLSAASSGLVLVAMGAFLYVMLECPQIDTTRFKWVPLVGMLVYTIVFCLGLGIAATFVLSELFSASIKGKGLCSVTISNALSQCITTKLFQVLEVNFAIYTPFTLFATVSLVSTFLVDYFVPETTGKTLEEIQQDFKREEKAKSAQGA